MAGSLKVLVIIVLHSTVNPHLTLDLENCEFKQNDLQRNQFYGRLMDINSSYVLVIYFWSQKHHHASK